MSKLAQQIEASVKDIRAELNAASHSQLLEMLGAMTMRNRAEILSALREREAWNKKSIDILPAALLWLRNHYHVGDPRLRKDVLLLIDRLLEEHKPTIEARMEFSRKYLGPSDPKRARKYLCLSHVDASTPDECLPHVGRVVDSAMLHANGCACTFTIDTDAPGDATSFAADHCRTEAMKEHDKRKI